MELWQHSGQVTASCQVCLGQGIAASDVLDLLSQLMDKSMVIVVARDGVARYRLLGPIRQYALERLQFSGEEPEYRERHASMLLSLPGPELSTILDLAKSHR
jgi:predicted ATPase